MIKYIFTDLDGTFLDAEKKPGIKSIEAFRILKQQGYHLGIATGRSVDIVLNLLIEWELKDQIDWIIGMNGAQLYHIKNNVLYRQHLLTIKQLKKLTSMLEHDDVNLYLYDCMNHKAMLKRMDDYGKTIINFNRSEYEIIDFTELHKSYEKMLVLAKPSKLSEINQKLNDYHSIKAMRTLPYCIEIVSQYNSKLNAIQNICDYENIHLSEVMAFGDEENDMEMIMGCQVGVAMRNGSEALKEKADACTFHTNNEDGVGEFLIQYFNIEKEV